MILSLLRKPFRILAPSLNFTAGLFVMAILGFFLLCFPTEITSDGTRYLIGAKFIHQGTGYVTYSLVSEEIVPQIDYPPLLSGAVASVMRLVGHDEIFALRLVNYLSLLAYYLSFYWLITLLFKENFLRVLANLLIIISPVSWRYLNTALSEMLFMGFFGFSILGCLKAVSCNELWKRRLLYLVTGVAVLLLCITRYSGLFIVGSSAAFFFLIGRRDGHRKISPEICLFLLPVVLGMGGWLMRNQRLSGHLTFLEVFPSRPFFEDFLRVEADFIRNVIEFITGFSTYRWAPPSLAFIPTVLFLLFGTLAAVTFWRMRRRPWAGRTQPDFLLLSFLTVAFHLLALNFFRLRNGFGETPRYFTILSPLIFLSVLVLIGRLIERGSSERVSLGRWRSVSLVALSGFLVLGVFFHSINSLKSVRDTVLARPSPVEGAAFPAFENSPWVFGLDQTRIKNHDIVVSNNPTFLSYVWARPCRITNRVSGQKVLAEVQDTFREAYLILDKEIPCFTPKKFDGKEYLGELKYEVVNEDSFTLAVRLVK